MSGMVEDLKIQIPHITNNIIPLSNLIKCYTNEAYSQLRTMVENLAITKGKDLDIIRRKKLLVLIISIRQNFVKLYTLVKWSCQSREIGKLIDLLNWFRTQESCFDQLTLKLVELNGFSAAKLPNSDLITSLQVLIKGRPQLPSYNLIVNPPISSQKILQVLKELNLLLMTRMALNDNIPLEYLHNHEIKHGRLILTLPKKYMVSVTIGNDQVVDKEEDYYKSPYFFIDFKFLFGQAGDQGQEFQSDKNFISTNITTSLSQTVFYKLETQCNQVLLKENLNGMYKLLNNFTRKFKFEVILQQLKSLNPLKWKTISFKFDNTKDFEKIIINYWTSPLNIIEILLDENLDVVYNWFKDNQRIKSPIKVDSDEFSIEYLLNTILNNHVELLIGKLLEESKALDILEESTNPYQMIVNLLESRKAVFSIDALLGKFYIVDPNVIEINFLQKINGFNFDNEEMKLIEYIVKLLIDLKLEVIANEITNRLIIMEWITNHIIQLKDPELTKLSENFGKHYKITYFRCKNWPSSWFLINIIDDNFRIKWYVSRIRSIKGEWRLQWVMPLDIKYASTFDFFNDLSVMCSNKIIGNMITEELMEKSIKFIELKPQEISTLDFGGNFTINSKAFEFGLLLYNNGEFLPVANSSNGLILEIKLINNHDEKSVEIRLTSKLKLLEDSNSDFIKNASISNLCIHDTYFEIKELVNLHNFGIDTEGLSRNIFKSLYKFNNLVKLINELNLNHIEILQSNGNLNIKVNEVFNCLYVQLPNEYNNAYYFTTENNDKYSDLIIRFINKAIVDDNVQLIGIINYLNLIQDVIKPINDLEQFMSDKPNMKLNNGLGKLYLNVKFFSLNHFELLFFVNSISSPNNKKIINSKIVLNVKFKFNKFKRNNNLDLTISLIDNLSLKDVKFKKLFELIYKRLKDNPKIVNLNYDFIVDLRLFDQFLKDIGNCFMDYIDLD